ncbi:FecCD family ABC transporter permease [Brumimicrobium aurantiacum]|uniref:Iron ABC transporter permease n=1 Tax=Brumimicrobium aurantiacum TaxID=1737063 RepID=A0A3E1F1M7_9FLAO|nr:iron ABC transporter permease [Brumimicrobium aurantiacum]RFC55653.1 iron ABC transporter permease [Brumimicrobium aurantiacum]
MKQNKTKIIGVILLILLIILSVLSAKFGAVKISNQEIWNGFLHLFSGTAPSALNERIFIQIRLPRVIMGVFVGAALAVGGVLMQALFRNPIVEPGLVGTSSGAAFGAALYFVLGATFGLQLGEWILPLAACLGGILSTALVFYLSQSKKNNKTAVISILLTGIAINALFLSGVGFLSYIARDPQARSITFWNLGTLSGAYWEGLYFVISITVLCILLSLRFSKQLNALMLGEQEAKMLGVEIRQLKIKVLLVNVIMVAVATAFVGVIGFVGLIVPHLLRMLNGSDNRFLIWSGAILGALVLTASDLIARLLLAPAELPIGIVTSMIGVPVFIFLLRRTNYFF